jgi:hypothetical protein
VASDGTLLDGRARGGEADHLGLAVCGVGADRHLLHLEAVSVADARPAAVTGHHQERGPEPELEVRS